MKTRAIKSILKCIDCKWDLGENVAIQIDGCTDDYYSEAEVIKALEGVKDGECIQIAIGWWKYSDDDYKWVDEDGDEASFTTFKAIDNHAYFINGFLFGPDEWLWEEIEDYMRRNK